MLWSCTEMNLQTLKRYTLTLKKWKSSIFRNNKLTFYIGLSDVSCPVQLPAARDQLINSKLASAYRRLNIRGYQNLIVMKVDSPLGNIPANIAVCWTELCDITGHQPRKPSNYFSIQSPCSRGRHIVMIFKYQIATPHLWGGHWPHAARARRARSSRGPSGY